MNHRHDNYGPTDTNYFCAFCGKTGDQVNAMISGPNGIYICDECISVCADAMMRDMATPWPRRWRCWRTTRAAWAG